MQLGWIVEVHARKENVEEAEYREQHKHYPEGLNHLLVIHFVCKHQEAPYCQEEVPNNSGEYVKFRESHDAEEDYERGREVILDNLTDYL